MNPIWSVGLMTGTVLDGDIDVALLRTDGERIDQFGAYALIPYPDEINATLADTLQVARDWDFTGPAPSLFAEAEEALTRAQADAVRTLVESAGLEMGDIGAIGFHGQTVLHRAPQPDRFGQTCQLGDGALMAKLLGVPTVYDFRSADMRAGGQGAPLAAIYHAALLDQLADSQGVAVLNLGGVANITYWDGQSELIAFDTGPASAPLNDFVKAQGLGEMDRDGLLAARGKVDEPRLAMLLTHSYMRKPFPKSLDRFDFSAAMAHGYSPENGAALLTAFTAAAVGKALDLLPVRPTKLIVCGGGRQNPTMMREIETRAQVQVVNADTIGWRGDAVEAECFAFLAVRALQGLPLSFPKTTGVAKPTTGGQIALPDG